MQLGNPETSDVHDWKGLVDYAWSHAVISDETHKVIKKSCDFNGTWSNDCSQAVDEVLHQYKQIDIYSLYTSLCTNSSSMNPDDNRRNIIMLKKSSSSMVSDENR